ncbi:hypothetical protein FA13DRAFT_1788142 [Coprinellus micaceus]|uniref:Uncharacterized protein n=1 Tax=Coprinellus micaceus TaxID=71717 RepID=A0A4Y7TMU3_COPMI|nr:hypothetical protein FA13DRAFT_1788142 [Coprinellus micaceus]
MPVFLLGSAIYLGLRLTQMNLSHERYMEQAEARIKALEDDIATLETSRRAAEATPPSGDAPQTEQQPSRWRLF